MLYRKYKADRLFTGTEVLSNDQVLITNEKGVVEAIVHESEAGENVLYHNGWIVPGLVNAHCHIELSHMKDVIPQHTGMVDFLLGILKQRRAEPEQIYDAIRKAEEEMVANGIVAVGDICNTADSLCVKRDPKLHYHSFVEVIGIVAETANETFQQAETVLNKFRMNEVSYRHSLSENGKISDAKIVSSSLTPHAPYTVSPALMKLIGDATAGQIISMHNEESRAENELFRTKNGDFIRLFEFLGIDESQLFMEGASSLVYWLPYFDQQHQIIMVHNVDMGDGDINFIRRLIQEGRITPPWCCVCPGANLYIQNQLPDFNLLYNSGLNMVIGTDSLSSNTSLDILKEIRTIHKAAPSIPLEEIFKWATIN
ncbi:MAG TPA: amidohydrolase family protein, partial [Parasegetibacter sp.]